MQDKSQKKPKNEISFSELRDDFVLCRGPENSPNFIFFQQDYIEKVRKFLELSKNPNETVEMRLKNLKTMRNIQFDKSFLFTHGFDILKSLFVFLVDTSLGLDTRVVIENMEYLSVLVTKLPNTFFKEILTHFRDKFLKIISKPINDINVYNQCINVIGVIARISKENARYLFPDFFSFVSFGIKENVMDIQREKLIGGYDYSFRSVRSFTLHLCECNFNFNNWKSLLIKISKFISSSSLIQNEDEPVNVPELSDAIYIFVDVIQDCLPGTINIIKETHIFNILPAFLISSNIEITRAAILLITYSFDNGIEFVNEMELGFTFEQLTRFLRHHDSIIRVEAARCLICIFSNQSSQMNNFKIDVIEGTITSGLYSNNLSFPEVINFVHLLLIIIEKYPSSEIYHFDISKFVEYGLDSLEKDNDELSYYILQSFIYMYIHLRNINGLDFFLPQFQVLNGLEIISSFSSNEIRELQELSFKLYNEIIKDLK